MWPSMVTHTLHCALHLTHPKCTHTAVNTHTCCGARGAVWGSVPCSRAPQSWYWGWRESAVHSLPHRQFLPARDFLRDYESDSLTIRSRLPQIVLVLSTDTFWYSFMFILCYNSSKEEEIIGSRALWTSVAKRKKEKSICFISKVTKYNTYFNYWMESTLKQIYS